MFVGSKRTGGLARLGEILLEAGLIKPDIVTQSLAISKNARLPIGRVLVMSGHCSDKVIENAVEAQSGIRSGKFTREYAVKLMRVANTNNVNIEQAGAIVAWDRTKGTNYGELGKFLLAAEMVEEEKVWAAHTRSRQDGSGLGIQLVADQIFAPRTLMDVLQVVVFARQELLPRPEAVLICQKLHKENMALEDACAAVGCSYLFNEPRIRLAELLVNANLLDEVSALDAVETSIEENRMVGEILISRGQLDLGILEAALNLQEMVHTELLMANYVGEVLELVKCLERPLDEVLSDLEEMNAAAQFINAAGLLSDEHKSQLYEQYEVNPLNIGKVLFASGLISDDVIRLACSCIRLVEAGIVDEAGAIDAMRYSVEHNVVPEEALVHLSITPLPSEVSAVEAPVSDVSASDGATAEVSCIDAGIAEVPACDRATAESSTAELSSSAAGTADAPASDIACDAPALESPEAVVGSGEINEHAAENTVHSEHSEHSEHAEHSEHCEQSDQSELRAEVPEPTAEVEHISSEVAESAVADAEQPTAEGAESSKAVTEDATSEVGSSCVSQEDQPKLELNQSPVADAEHSPSEPSEPLTREDAQSSSESAIASDGESELVSAHGSEVHIIGMSVDQEFDLASSSLLDGDDGATLSALNSSEGKAGNSLNGDQSANHNDDKPKVDAVKSGEQSSSSEKRDELPLPPAKNLAESFLRTNSRKDRNSQKDQRSFSKKNKRRR